jgi:hypothetical protein
MADILIRIRDKETSGDAETDALQFKSGDVVVICETPWPWSVAEQTNPDWRILRLPLVTAQQMSDLMLPQLGSVDANGNTPLRRKRGKRIGIEGFTGQVRQWIDDDTRAEPILSRNFTLAQIQAFYETKTAR